MTNPAWTIEDGAISAEARTVLADLELDIMDHAVTVLLGPGGTGKSLMLNALSGRRLPDEIRVAGRWRYRGRGRPWSAADVALFTQSRAGLPSPPWRQALSHPAPALLLDEPDRLLAAGEQDELVERVRARRERGPVVLVTHHVELARRVADWVGLVVAGRVEAFAPADSFFDSPPTPLAAQYVRSGNCWPRHELPRHFHWLLPSLAGMGRPGLMGDLLGDLAALVDAGIGLVVSLTETPLPTEALHRAGLASRHFPIVDMGVPSLEETARLCADMQREIDSGTSVVVHCHAGLGRTGTILAAYLVWCGRGADEAVAAVRAVKRGSIQTTGQHDFVRRFASRYGLASQAGRGAVQ